MQFVRGSILFAAAVAMAGCGRIGPGASDRSATVQGSGLDVMPYSPSGYGGGSHGGPNLLGPSGGGGSQPGSSESSWDRNQREMNQRGMEWRQKDFERKQEQYRNPTQFCSGNPKACGR